MKDQLAKKSENLKGDNFIDAVYERIQGQNRETIKVIHISDVHLDFGYTPGTNADCNMPICCNKENGFTSDPTKAAGFWGDIRCDIPVRVYESMLDFAKEEIKPDAFIWTGDNSKHNVWQNTQEEIISYVDKINEIWKQKFDQTDVSMFPIQGNHDTWPVNVQKFNKPGQDAPILHYAELWKEFFTTEEAYQTFKKWGYYSMPMKLKNGKVLENINVIGLNCQAGNNMNWRLFEALADPAQMLEWFENELVALQKVGGKAVVISHIPPVHFVHAFGARLWSLFDRFQDTIRFNAYGHTHFEEFQMIPSLSNSSKAVNWSWIAGSLVSYTGMYPSFSVIELDKEEMIPLDIDTYWFDLDQANAQNKPIWKHYHSFKEDYGIKNLSPSEMMKLTQQIKESEAVALKYKNNMTRNGTHEKSCDKACRLELYCNVSTTEAFALEDCLNGGKPPLIRNPFEYVVDPWLKRID